MVAIGEPARIIYTNYRGETAERTITPKRVWYGISDWHPEPQWFLTAFDHDKNADRDFALIDFGHPQPSTAPHPFDDDANPLASNPVDDKIAPDTSGNADELPSDGSCVRCGSVPRNASGLCNTCLDEDAARLDNTRPAPAARDTGLVTVARQYRWGGNPKWKPFGPIFDDEPRETRELCDRSQAVELLAAERAENARLNKALDIIFKNPRSETAILEARAALGEDRRPEDES
ncbi:hypothetical protein [Brucella anthropi]|uniref:hypothetical protein n=1 Tax=Brucella anthropi TaxID=529 RepID=UPI00244B760B|nr:hypothetical protein [Brucella anthropi]MDG9790560.1 hypothetical protein [Brucella anthropi]MDH0580641.1 hypothetical protein [Brucella anthropi]MDH0817265.1 hypothetical protein [Brucella anthropi]MDH2084077.1 hypothetical protein [Brucella anthropi]